MMISFNKKRVYLLIAGAVVFAVLYNVLVLSGQLTSRNIPIPGLSTGPKHTQDSDEAWDYKEPLVHDPGKIGSHEGPPSTPARHDLHPIARLMKDADDKWRIYEGSRSTTFRQTVEKYRSKYGRHPPPGFVDWYKFARNRNVYNIDDFEHIMDDLRPFWAVPPADIRSHAAHMWENPEHGIAGIHVRDKKVAKVNQGSWRSETMEKMIKTFVKYLPDMDIAMNKLDQPRLVVPWEDLQEMLKKEHETRIMSPEAADSFSTNQTNLLDTTLKTVEEDKSTRLDAGWFGAPGKQYMLLASKACPPESPARANLTLEQANAMYKEKDGGFVNNFNLSSDLCTVGPAIQDLHGMLYSASSITASHKLVPVFGECKVNINNDIMFPANMYYMHDERYDYNPSGDVDWRDKSETLIWRGVTSGGVQLADNWQRMHRQRLVQLMNGTWMTENNQTVQVLGSDREISIEDPISYNVYDDFRPGKVADRISDVGFVEAWGCIPDCSFYKDIFSWKHSTTLTEQFRSKYLIDVDGHSFSGRWHAFLQSKSLGLKATIFREWHDSRLFAWRHFVPLDNRYDDIYGLLTYFVGYGSPNMEHAAENGDPNPQVYVAPHELEAQKIARQSRDWAHKVLRREDIEVYMFRLMLEYARISDDNRDYIGYSGDGSELDAFDNGMEGKNRWGIPGWLKSEKESEKNPKQGE